MLYYRAWVSCSNLNRNSELWSNTKRVCLHQDWTDVVVLQEHGCRRRSDWLFWWMCLWLSSSQCENRLALSEWWSSSSFRVGNNKKAAGVSSVRHCVLQSPRSTSFDTPRRTRFCLWSTGQDLVMRPGSQNYCLQMMWFCSPHQPSESWGQFAASRPPYLRLSARKWRF